MQFRVGMFNDADYTDATSHGRSYRRKWYRAASEIDIF